MADAGAQFQTGVYKLVLVFDVKRSECCVELVFSLLGFVLSGISFTLQMTA